MGKLGFTICDPLGHPWICLVPKRFIASEIKLLQDKINREDLKVRKTTQVDIERVINWTFEKYLKRTAIKKIKKKI